MFMSFIVVYCNLCIFPSLHLQATDFLECGCPTGSVFARGIFLDHQRFQICFANLPDFCRSHRNFYWAQVVKCVRWASSTAPKVWGCFEILCYLCLADPPCFKYVGSWIWSDSQITQVPQDIATAPQVERVSGGLSSQPSKKNPGANWDEWCWGLGPQPAWLGSGLMHDLIQWVEWSIAILG